MDPTTVKLGDRVSIRDPATDTTLHQGHVTEVNSEWFTVDVNDGRPRRFNFAPGGQIAPVDRPHRYEVARL